VNNDLNCLPSQTSRRKKAAQPFQNTGMLARQTGVPLAGANTARRLLRWLALRGAPPGNRALPEIA